MKERRKNRRLAHPFSVEVRVLGQRQWLSVQADNASLCGLRYRASGGEPVGELLEVRIFPPQPQEAFTLCGEVVWCEGVASRVSDLGLRFIKLDPAQRTHLESLVESLDLIAEDT